MIEDEAKTKWCPFVRAVFGYEEGSSMSFNRFVTNPEDVERMGLAKAINDHQATRCIGSKCACWIPKSRSTGHCGLAK